MGKDIRLLHPHEVCRMTTFSRGQLDKMVIANLFPPPVNISARRLVWVQSEVEDWIEEKIAESREKHKSTSIILDGEEIL